MVIPLVIKEASLLKDKTFHLGFFIQELERKIALLERK